MCGLKFIITCFRHTTTRCVVYATHWGTNNQFRREWLFLSLNQWAISPLGVLACHWPNRWASMSCSGFSTLKFRVDPVNPTYWTHQSSCINVKNSYENCLINCPKYALIGRQVARGLQALSILPFFLSSFLSLSTTFLFFSELFGICCCNQSAVPCWRLLLHWFFKIFHQRLKHYIVLQSASSS